MTSRSSFYRSLRRFRVEKHSAPLRQRDRSALPYLHSLGRPFPKLLLDTTVYIDALQGRLSPESEVLLRVSELWHSTVAEAELSSLAGLLDPRHPDTSQVVKQVADSIEKRPDHRILNPNA